VTQEEIDPLWLKKISEEGIDKSHDTSPPQLWLIPIMLREWNNYLKDAEAAVLKDIERQWEMAQRYQSRQEFESGPRINSSWKLGAPLWWGLNDVIGFIDLRLIPWNMSIEATLFLTRKRASRQLVVKQYVARGQERFILKPGMDNQRIQEGTIQIVETLAKDPRLVKRCLPLADWRRMVRNTNFITLILELESFTAGQFQGDP